MKPLYHGSTEVFDIIDPSKGKGYKDFGRGFYATAVKSHAESIARRNKKIKIKRQDKILERNPSYKKERFTAYRYNLFYSEDTDGLNVKIFDKADIEWVKFILQNRKSKYTTHDYDIVIGPTADEETTTIINEYEAELERSNYADAILLRLINELKPEKLPKQYFFANNKSIKTLKFNIRGKREIVG